MSQTKKYTWLLLSFSFMLQMVAAQNSPPNEDIGLISTQKYNTVVKTNPFAIIWGAIPLTAEYRIMLESVTSKNQSAQISVSYLGKSPILSLIESDSTFKANYNNFKYFIKGYRVQAMYKFYLTQFKKGINPQQMLAPEGWYIGPHVSYSTAIFTTKYFSQFDRYARITHFNINALIGYQVILDDFSMDVFAGFGYKSNQWIERHSANVVRQLDTSDLSDYYNNNFKVNIGVNFGYAFSR